MRKKGVLLSTIILGLALTACGDIRNLNDLKEAIGLASDSSGGDDAQEESTNAESLPAVWKAWRIMRTISRIC